MSTSRLQSTIDQYRKQLAAHEATAAHALNTAHAATVKKIQPKLNTLYQQIADKQASGEPAPLHWLYDQSRLQATKDVISGNIDEFGALAHTQVGQLQHTGVQLGLQSGQAQLQATKPASVKYSFGVPSQKAIQRIVGVTRNGSPLADLFAGFGAEAAQKAAQALIAGITLGDNPRTIAPLVEDALNISRNRALVISRNEMLRAYKDAALETYRENYSVCTGWVWICALDERSCISCIMMHGSYHSLGEDLDGHVLCRCSKSPLTRSWSDILGDVGIDDASDIEETSLDLESGEDWFSKQDDSMQKQILGPMKYDAYKNNSFAIKDVVGKTHSADWGVSIREKSLKELVK